MGSCRARRRAVGGGASALCRLVALVASAGASAPIPTEVVRIAPDRWGQPGDNQELFPEGTWSHDATELAFQGNHLCAQLRRPDGAFAERRDCAYVHDGSILENDAGHFRSLPAPRLPGGTWILSARNVRMDGRVLIAELQRDDGETWVPQYTFAPDFHRYRNDDGIFRRTNSACASLLKCVKGYTLRAEAEETICPDLDCDPLRDLELCCTDAMPCENLTTCVFPKIPDPWGYCFGEECVPELDMRHCCVARAKCSTMVCSYGWVHKALAEKIECAARVCDLGIELELCCDRAARCSTIPEAQQVCPFGLYFNDLEFCGGTMCLPARDLDICCQSAAVCDTMVCPNGYVFKENITSEHCDGPTCVVARDRATCCDDAEACANDTAIVCAYGWLIPPDRYCLGTSCYPERDIMHCCKSADPCTSLGEEAMENCSFGYFFNKTDYCAGTLCDLSRDAEVCCQPAAPCAFLDCTYGYILKPQELLPHPTDRGFLDTLYCEGLVCDVRRDRDTCCDKQASCLTLPCPRGFLLAWNASDRLCLGPTCVSDRDAPVCCDAAEKCSEGYACPHGYVGREGLYFCGGVECDVTRDLNACCLPAEPCTSLTCPENFVHRPNMYCKKPAGVPFACKLSVDLNTCCDRGMALFWYRFVPIKVRDYKSFQVQIAELNLYFYGSYVNGSKHSTGGIAFSINGTYPEKENPEKAIDEDVGTKWLDADPDPKWTDGRVYEWMPLTVQLTAAHPADRFSFVTANDIPQRDPIKWRLEGSPDNIHWPVLHDFDDDGSSITLDRFTETERFVIKVPCFAPRHMYIPNAGLPYTCEEGDIVSSGTICTPKCLPGFTPSATSLACGNGQLVPGLFSCISPR